MKTNETNETKEETEQRLLIGVEENALETLEFSLVQQHSSDFTTELAHHLFLNESVSAIHLIKTEDPSLEESKLDVLFKAFSAAGPRITSLKYTDLDAPSYCLPTLLWQFRNLQSLSLHVDSALSKALKTSRVLWRHNSLESIELYYPSGNGATLGSLEKLLVDDLSTIRHLSSFTLASDACTLEVQPSSLARLVSDTPLKRLCCGVGFRQGCSMTCLLTALSNSRIRDLSLPYINLSSMDLVELMESLCEQNRRTLRELDLSGNVIGEDKAELVCRVLSSNPQLTDLRLYDCNLGDLTARGLADVMKHHPGAYTLDCMMRDAP
jgi:hypothetical protein